MERIKKIFICSPFRGNIKENRKKAKEYSREVALAGHIPITPHIYFTEFLNDDNPEERELGMELGRKLLDICDEMWIYGEPTEGMLKEIKRFKKKKVRKL